MATIEEMRAAHHRIMAQPGGAGTPLVAKCWRCRESWPCDTVTVLAALDEAKTREAALLFRSKAMRNHLVDQRKWGYMATPGVTEYQAAQMAVEWLRTQGLEEEAHGDD